MCHKMEVFHNSFLCILTQETRTFVSVRLLLSIPSSYGAMYKFGHHDTRDGMQKMLGTEFSTVYKMQEQSFLVPV